MTCEVREHEVHMKSAMNPVMKSVSIEALDAVAGGLALPARPLPALPQQPENYDFFAPYVDRNPTYQPGRDAPPTDQGPLRPEELLDPPPAERDAAFRAPTSNQFDGPVRSDPNEAPQPQVEEPFDQRFVDNVPPQPEPWQPPDETIDDRPVQSDPNEAMQPTADYDGAGFEE